MRHLFLFLLTAAFVFGCTPSPDEPVDPNVPENPAPQEPAPEEPEAPDPEEPDNPEQPAPDEPPPDKPSIEKPSEPVLVARFDATECAPNETVAGLLVISQKEAGIGHALATTLLTGAARIAIDGVLVPTRGEWIVVQSDTLHVSVTPDEEGEVRIGFQVRTQVGEVCSNRCEAVVTAEFPPELTAEAECEAQLVNPHSDETVPVHLTIDYPKYAGEYTIRPSVIQGKGTFLYQGEAVGEDGIATEEERVTIEYRPAALGEQLLAFDIQAGEAAKQVCAYVEVAKRLTVKCAASNGITITGEGEYATEGECAILELRNDPGYNFEASGWYDAAGNRLSTGNRCELVVTYETAPDIVLELKKRRVRLTLTSSYRKPYNYPVANASGRITGWKTVYDYRRNLQSDYRLSDEIRLYYEKYRWTLTVPPTEQKAWTVESATGYFWRIDDDFTIYLRRSDNPQLRFDPTEHAAESETTRYIFPNEIEIQ